MTSIAKRKTVIALAASALFATLSGCAVGPDFKTPAGDKAERYTADALPEKTVATPVAGGEAQTLQPGARLPPQWWQLFGSDLISERVDQAFAHSPSLAAAEAALREAQEMPGPQMVVTGRASISTGRPRGRRPMPAPLVPVPVAARTSPPSSARRSVCRIPSTSSVACVARSRRSAHWPNTRDRKSVVSGKGVSVRGGLGGRRSIKKKKT